MAPIEPDLHNSNVLALSILGGYLCLAGGLLAFIFRSVLYKAYQALPPSQVTRHRQRDRRKHVRTFALLSLVSLCTTIYHAVTCFVLSYRVWAHEMGEDLPPTLFSADLLSNLALGRWLRDTSFLRDEWELTVENSRRYWWTQQLLLCLAAWSVFVGLEGRKRNIRHLWAFLLLAECVGLSCAMNLFFVAVLLAPVPLPVTRKRKERTSSTHKRSNSSTIAPTATAAVLKDRFLAAFDKVKPYLPPLPTQPHPATWHPSPWAFLPSLATFHLAAFLLPFSTSTPTFSSLILILVAGPVRLIYLDRLAPSSYGSTRAPHPRSYSLVYRYVSLASLALFAKQTFVALLDNDPGAHYHRHSSFLSKLRLPHEHTRGLGTRSGSAVGSVLGALNDHPAVALVGWDALLSGFSLCCWAAVRGLDIQMMLAAAGFTRRPSSGNSLGAVPLSAALVPTDSGNVTGTVRRRKRNQLLSEEAETAADDKTAQDDATFQPHAPEKSIVRGEEEARENSEAGGVAGALLALGGLGVCASAVLGAE